MPSGKGLLDNKIIVALEAAARSLGSGSSYVATGRALLKVLEINTHRIKDAEEKDLIPSRLYKPSSNSSPANRSQRGSFRVSQIPPQLRPLYKVIFEVKRWIEAHTTKGQRAGRKAFMALLDLLQDALKQAAHATKLNLSTFPRSILEDLWEKDTVAFMEKQPKVCLVVWVVDEDEDTNLSHYDERDLTLFIFQARHVKEKLGILSEAVNNYKFDDRIRFVISCKHSKEVLQSIVDTLGTNIPVMINSGTIKVDFEAAIADFSKIKSDVLISGRDEDFDTFCRFAMLLWIDGSEAEDRKMIAKRAQKSGVVIVKTPSTEKGLKYLETHGFLGGVGPFRIIVGDKRRAEADKAAKKGESKADLKSSAGEGDEDLPASELVEIIRSRLRWHTPILVYYEKKEYQNLSIYDFKSVRLTSELNEAVEFASMKPITWAPDLSYYRDGEAITDKRDGLSDPYVVFNLGETKLKAPKILATLNPVWNDLKWEVHCKLTDKVSFDVWDWDRIGGHDFEGRTEFDLSHFMPFPIDVIEITRRLQPRTKDGKVKDEAIAGTITVELGFESIEQKMMQSSTAAHAAGHSKHALGRHFGRPLEESLRTANETMELHLIDKAIAFIRSKAIKTQGVFRLPGNATRINELRARIDRGEDVDLDSEDEHDIPSLLKMFFRELPDPLFPSACFKEFLAAANIDDRKKRIAHFSRILRDATLVPVVNRDVLIDLVHLMDEIARHEEVNKMTHRNLATCLAPTIVIPNGINASPVEVLTQTKTVTDLLEFVIINHESIFKSILDDGGIERRKSARELTQQRVEKRSGTSKDKKDKDKKSLSSSRSSSKHSDEKTSPRDRSSSVSSKKGDSDVPASPRDKDKDKTRLRDSTSSPRSSSKESSSTKTRESRSDSVKSPRGTKESSSSSSSSEGKVVADLTMALFDEPVQAPPAPAPRRGLKRTNNSGAVTISPATAAAALGPSQAKPAAEEAAAPAGIQVPEEDVDDDPVSVIENDDEDDEIERLERELREAELKEAELLREAEIKERTGKSDQVETKDSDDKLDDMDDDEIDKLLMEDDDLLEDDSPMTPTSPTKHQSVADDDDGFNPDDVDMDD